MTHVITMQLSEFTVNNRKKFKNVAAPPPPHSSAKNWARHLRVHGAATVKIKNPAKYLHSSRTVR